MALAVKLVLAAHSTGSLNISLKVPSVPSERKFMSLVAISRPVPVCSSWMVALYSEGPWMAP